MFQKSIDNLKIPQKKKTKQNKNKNKNKKTAAFWFDM